MSSDFATFKNPNQNLMIIENRFPEAKLELSDGTVHHGRAFGAAKPISGEIVFTTGMVGYVESMTDPSYQGQVLVLTYPMIGNYGVPDSSEKDKWGLSKNFESFGGKIYVSGLVISELCEDPNHWQSVQTLHEWCVSQNIPGIFSIDTRAVATRLRESSGLLCKILPAIPASPFSDSPQSASSATASSVTTSGMVGAGSGSTSGMLAPPGSNNSFSGNSGAAGAFATSPLYPDIPWEDPNQRVLVKEVSTVKRLSFGHGSIRILCLDMGCKQNTIRCFMKYDVTFTLAPFNTVLNEETEKEYDGLFVSNGPGDPALYQETIANVRWALGRQKPIFGICMGNQILGLACGCTTHKMKYGNRGQNQPCQDHTSSRVYITSQNHGFAVDVDKLPSDWEPYFTNVNDGSNEGIRHKSKPFFSVQFHPEARCGPEDTEFLFKKFVDEVRDFKVRDYTTKPVRSVVVLGAGGITIGQAGEFDFSGSQCLKSLREEGIKSILINPNIATVQTEKLMADEIYFCAVTPENVEMVFEKEKPDAILLGWGGQTALNCGIALHDRGILQKYEVRVLGTPISAIKISEDRELFRDALLEINEHVARSIAVTSVSDAVLAAREIGYPVMIRAAFTLGGQGSGIVKDEAELRHLAAIALAASPQILVEESVYGWKELEYEVVRDVQGNTITVCNMENFDPMGIHTGESIVVAPSQTLANDEYHMLRSAAVKIINHLGIIGECNIQYGLHPKSRRYVVIEVNARLSRSSALASKATGYPLAHVAVKLALGKQLYQVKNAVTKTTSACFEPSLDYIVIKVPRWDLGKFNMVSDRLGTMMKSIGETMAIGRSFEEVIQKALRMVDNTTLGFMPALGSVAKWNFVEDMLHPTPRRIFAIATALYHGYSTEMIHDLTKVDVFFLTKLQNIISTQRLLYSTFQNHIATLPRAVMVQAKKQGFSDKQIGVLVGAEEVKVRQRRYDLNVFPVAKRIDTVAGEFPAFANYLYTTYNATQDDIEFTDISYVVIGAGIYRVGNSVEFDYSAVLVTRELRERGHKVLLINHNPETVSTDYDECDRLYFEELSVEVILDILRKERNHGVIASVGGQLAQNMALGLKRANVKLLGTDADDIDRAEDRNKFSNLCDSIGVDQPAWASVVSTAAAHDFAQKVGFPVLVRPSYVLSGSAMAVIWNSADIDRYLSSASKVSGRHPVVISKFIRHSTEYDVDLVAHKGNLLCHAVCEHLENAGVHSGDATMFLPPQRASRETVDKLVAIATKLAIALRVTGPLNVQMLITPEKEIKVIEANVRSSRSVPFVSKVLHTSFPAAMVSAFLGPAHAPFPMSPPITPNYYGGSSQLHNDPESPDLGSSVVNNNNPPQLPLTSVSAAVATTTTTTNINTSSLFQPSGGKFALKSTPPLAPLPNPSTTTTTIGGMTHAHSNAPHMGRTPQNTPIGKPMIDKYVQPNIMDLPFVGCKASMFSFIRLSGADPILGVEMASTGEVGVMGRDRHEALFLAMEAQSFRMPKPGTGCLIDICDPKQAEKLIPYIKKLSVANLKMYATEPAAAIFSAQGVDLTVVQQPPLRGGAVTADMEPNVKTLLSERKISLTIQLRDKTQDFLLRRMKQKDAPAPYWVRRLSIDFNASLITESAICRAFCDAFARFAGKQIDVQSYNKTVVEPLDKMMQLQQQQQQQIAK